MNVPESIGALQQLGSLDLRKNQLQGLPRSFSALTQLLFLDLRDNLLSQSIHHLWKES